MEIIIDLSSIQNFFAAPVDVVIWRLFLYYGWIILGWIFLIGAKQLWLYKRQSDFLSKVRYTFLAIDVPQLNLQSPKAVENLFTYLGGAHSSISFFDKYWEGKVQLYFSFEIVSIDGYTQFIIHTPVQFKSLVETAVYSQYPDAELSEIDDYTENIPDKYPNDEYDVWGADFIPVANHMFPIKTYEQFEHRMGPEETVFRDPMASLMDLFSSLRKGEQAWYQVLVQPTGFDWVKEADSEVDKILGVKPKVSWGSIFTDILLVWIMRFSEFIYSLWDDISIQEKEFKSKSMVELNPREKKQIEALHDKSSKLGFEAKVRFCYVAKKEIFSASKVVSGFVGYIKQFTSLDLNSFKPDMTYTATSTAYFANVKRLNEKKKKIVRNYKNRSIWGGRLSTIYTIDELATIWHFPLSGSVKAPLIQKAPTKRSQPPIYLPTEEVLSFSDQLETLNDLDDFVPTKVADDEFAKPEPEKKVVSDLEPIMADDLQEEELRHEEKIPSNLPFE